MIRLLFLAFCCFGFMSSFGQEILNDSTEVSIPCKISVDSTDEFDSTRMVITDPLILGYMIPTQNLTDDLEGKTLTEEAKTIFTYAEGTNNVRSFFLTLVVTEYDYLKIENGYTVYLKLTNGKLVKLYNVPDNGELNRDIIMWLYQHTCVVPLEIYHLLKHEKVEKIRINYENAKRTIVLNEEQQTELQRLVLCVEATLRGESVLNP